MSAPSPRLYRLVRRGPVPQQAEGVDHLAWAHLWRQGPPVRPELASAEQLEAGLRPALCRYERQPSGEMVAEFWEVAEDEHVEDFVRSRSGQLLEALAGRPHEPALALALHRIAAAG